MKNRPHLSLAFSRPEPFGPRIKPYRDPTGDMRLMIYPTPHGPFEKPLAPGQTKTDAELAYAARRKEEEANE